MSTLAQGKWPITAGLERQAKLQRHADKDESQSLRNLWRFIAFSGRYAWWMVAGLITGWARMVLTLVMPLYYATIIDDVISAKGPTIDERWSHFWTLTFWLGLWLIIHLLVSLGRNYFPAVVCANTIRDIRFELYAHLQRLSLGFHTQRPTGTIVARLMTDVGQAQNVFSMILIWGTQAIMLVVGIGGYMLYKDLPWALICFSTIPIFLLTTRLLRRPIRRNSRQILETKERMSGRVHERMAMIREVQSFTAEKHEANGLWGDIEELRVQSVRQKVLGGTLVAASEITRIIASIVLIGFGVHRILHGDAKIGVLVAFYMYLNELMRPVEALTLMYGQIQTTAAATDRIFEFWDTEPVIKNADNANPIALKSAPSVEFEKVRFTYPKDDADVTLADVSFKVKPGAKVVLVGESGAGKSTLMSLLPRFYDVQEGRIRVQGQEITGVTVKSLRKAIGIVPQEPVLFSGTIRENILYGRRDASAEEVVAAAKDANALEFIEELPEGFDTEIGERGVGLSGGQIQRIAIARAFLKDPQILILDEATSNLDAKSENLVLDAIERLAQGRTTFMIAHRLSVARSCDQILVVREGHIAESGNHDELLDRDGIYAGLWRRQMEGVA